MIVTVGHEKGGCGKTTTATNLATWLAHAGRDVLLLDADRQCSATHWAAVRAQDDNLARVPCVQATGNIGAAVRDLATRYGDIVIDCGGRDSAELRSSLLVADVLVAPIRPSQLDLWAVTHLGELVVSARALNPHLRAYAALAMVPTNVRVTEGADARAMLSTHTEFALLKPVLYDRKAYRDAVCGGWGVIEMDDAKAAAEVHALGEVIYGQVSRRSAAAV
jgi:chromosome partitioning protein